VKILTGRNDRLHTLRQQGGLSGFLRRDESEHDQFGAGHAGTALSAAYGMATAPRSEARGVRGRRGGRRWRDECGLPYEALNQRRGFRPHIIVVLTTTACRSRPTSARSTNISALSSRARSPCGIRERVKHLIERASHIVGGKKLVDFAKNVGTRGIKNLWSPGMLFEELGFPLLRTDRMGINIGQMLHRVRYR